MLDWLGFGSSSSAADAQWINGIDNKWIVGGVIAVGVFLIFKRG